MTGAVRIAAAALPRRRDVDTEWEWSCSCDSSDCRKLHLSGFFHVFQAVRYRYLALLDDWSIAENQDEVDALKRQIRI
ncbi:hypothetical protein BSF38_04904 [Paludisphaera borealis]|uniref:Uncharacterized protein n=1 Tax=Paludisphaera borealis TaxID=1387353 RepID=A0A1U7CWK9_9BACT|nr:hypothetical protein BSF38_04904 [Paludisphaera borealis]